MACLCGILQWQRLVILWAGSGRLNERVLKGLDVRKGVNDEIVGEKIWRR